MKCRRFLAVALLMLSPAAGADRIVSYAIDTAQTQVRFVAGRSWLFRPEAVFTGVTGTIRGNLDHPERSTVQVRIPVASLESDMPLVRRRLIESGDFFRVREYPVMTFQGSGLRDIDRRQGRFRLVGELTVNGIRRPVVLEARLDQEGGRLFHARDRRTGFTATTQVSRSAFGMGRHVPLVGDTLYIDITLVAIRAGSGHVPPVR